MAKINLEQIIRDAAAYNRPVDLMDDDRLNSYLDIWASAAAAAVKAALIDAMTSPSDEDVADIAEILIAHTRTRGINGDCSCGIVVPLGQSFPAHQAEAILAARVFLDTDGRPPLTLEGFCPSCGHATLNVEPGDFLDLRVTCTNPNCARKTATHEILMDGETHHIVRFEGARYHLMHPLHERLDGELLVCLTSQKLAAMDETPVPSGKYRIHRAPAGKATVKLTFEAVTQ